MLNRVIAIAYIMYGLVGCTYEVQNTEDDMTTPRFAQQRSKRGNLNPGSGTNSQVNFQLAHIVNEDTGISDPGNYTLQFSVSDPNTGLAGGDLVRARAEIIWVAGGNSVRRVMDCGNGASITGTCEGVIVNIYDDSIVSHGSVFVPYTVSLSLAKGSRPSIQQPPVYSLDNLSLAPSGTTTVDIPQNIGAVSVFTAVSPVLLGTAIGAYDILEGQLSNAAGLKSYDPRQSDWVPLIAGATKLSLGRSAAAPATNWQITFGIDG